MDAGRGRRLRRLTTAVVVVGVAAVATTLMVLGTDVRELSQWTLPALALLVAVANAAAVRVRIRSTNVGSTWTDAAIMLCIVALSPPLVPLCVFAGVLLAKLARRISFFKSVYNASKDALSATAGLAVALAFGVAGSADPLSQPLGLMVAAITVVAVENAIGVPVLALASATPWRRVIGTDGDIKLASMVGKFIVVLLTIAVFQDEPWLVLTTPAVAFCLHLYYLGRVRTRTERAAWQRLAATTDELNNTDLEVVLAAAVANAAALFAADEAEVFLRDGPDGPILVRGDADGVRWTGDPGHAPPHRYDGESLVVRLAGHDLKADLGEVRLFYAAQVTLSDRERLILRTFVSALRTAVRNASAYAEARRLASRNKHAAMHDSLTGFANRRNLQQFGDSVLSGSGEAAIVVLDLDKFRDVNKALGHLAGDRLLAEVARRLRRAVGPDDVIARLDGDEFAVLIIDVPSIEFAEQRARDLLATLDAPIDLGERRARVEASAGVATLGGAPGGMVELLRRGDVAMYQAKRGGAQVVRYESSRDTADINQLTVGGELPRAVAKQEFVMNFQPIVDLATGDMVAAEALARWRHPERGDLDPRRFLAAVEQSGHLPAFAEAVLDQALDAMLRWRAAGVDAPVAVNASPRSLIDPSFARLVAARLAAHRVQASDLIIELTESLTLSQLEMAGRVLAELGELGVRLALDDFGTGDSSLMMLTKVPVYELKIDRSFVMAMQDSARSAAVVRSTIDMARRLSLTVVAEGIERPDQRQWLLDLGCAWGQGHLFSKPVSIEALLDVVSAAPGVPAGRIWHPASAP